MFASNLRRVLGRVCSVGGHRMPPNCAGFGSAVVPLSVVPWPLAKLPRVMRAETIALEGLLATNLPASPTRGTHLSPAPVGTAGVNLTFRFNLGL